MQTVILKAQTNPPCCLNTPFWPFYSYSYGLFLPLTFAARSFRWREVNFFSFLFEWLFQDLAVGCLSDRRSFRLSVCQSSQQKAIRRNNVSLPTWWRTRCVWAMSADCMRFCLRMCRCGLFSSASLTQLFTCNIFSDSRSHRNVVFLSAFQCLLPIGTLMSRFSHLLHTYCCFWHWFFKLFCSCCSRVLERSTDPTRQTHKRHSHTHAGWLGK